MRLTIPKIFEVAANICIVVVAILLVFIIVKNYLWPRLGAPRIESTIHAGSTLALAGVNWGNSEQTLLLVLSKNCHFCSESAPFYERLSRQVQTSGGRSRLVAVLPEDVGTSRDYLNGLKISITEIIQASPISIGTNATPTLILVDQRGVVKSVWIGKLVPEKEAEVLNHLAAADSQK